MEVLKLFKQVSGRNGEAGIRPNQSISVATFAQYMEAEMVVMIIVRTLLDIHRSISKVSSKH